MLDRFSGGSCYTGLRGPDNGSVMWWQCPEVACRKGESFENSPVSVMLSWINCELFWYSIFPEMSKRLMDYLTGNVRVSFWEVSFQPQVHLARSGESDLRRSGSFGLQIRTGYGFSEHLLLHVYASPHGVFSISTFEDGDRRTQLDTGVGVMYFPNFRFKPLFARQF